MANALLANQMADHRKRALYSNPFVGDSEQNAQQKRDLEKVLFFAFFCLFLFVYIEFVLNGFHD
jgi:hypothetical protein